MNCALVDARICYRDADVRAVNKTQLTLVVVSQVQNPKRFSAARFRAVCLSCKELHYLLVRHRSVLQHWSPSEERSLHSQQLCFRLNKLCKAVIDFDILAAGCCVVTTPDRSFEGQAARDFTVLTVRSASRAYLRGTRPSDGLGAPGRERSSPFK